MLKKVSLVLVAITSLLQFSFANGCCSLFKAEFTNTKGWVAEQYKDGDYVHVLAYQNRLQNLASSGGKAVGNAMFLPIPAIPGTMTEANMLDTSHCNHILDDMEKSVDQYRESMKVSVAQSVQGFELVQVFDRGAYTVVLAQHANDIPGALKRVPAEKRPNINQKIFDAYEKWYPGWTFALCCFNSTEMKNADPMVWWYKPLNPNQLFFPALDCHTGDVPSLTAQVQVDHCLMASSPSLDKACSNHPVDQIEWMHGMNSGHPPVQLPVVSYTDNAIPGSVKHLLPQRVTGIKYKRLMQNGDFVISVKDVIAAGDTHSYEHPSAWRRVLPPGANTSAK